MKRRESWGRGCLRDCIKSELLYGFTEDKINGLYGLQKVFK
jgi:hypothetical protein